MFIKLIRKEGSPIWINASSIVTVEPNKSDGSIVVPAGDGLDYEVVESPEIVLAMINGEKLPEVEKSKRTTRKSKVKEESKEEKIEAVKEEAPKKEVSKKETPKKEKAKLSQVEMKTKKSSRARATKKGDAKKEEAPKEEPIFFPAEHLDRLRRMAPGSLRKLSNTLVTQFKVTDPNRIIKHLSDTGVILIVEHGHINWLAPMNDNVLKA